MGIRANTGDCCNVFRFEGDVTAWTIEKSVGFGGVNRKEDVKQIQELLNLIPPADGGAAPPLAEDGLIGPKTLAAIKAFQQFHKTASDGRVDPKGPTLKKMNEVPKPKVAAANAGRLARVATAMPTLVAMAREAGRKAEEAMDFVRLGRSGVSTKKKAYDMADLYFGFGQQSDDATLNDLAFIRTTFTRVRTVLSSPRTSPFGGSPFGVNIFTIDPLGKDWAAYSRTQFADDNRPIPEVHSGHVFLGRGMDDKGPDLFAHILLHETVHFVDEESDERRIVDHGYREKAMRLPHTLRMHTSDIFALFASHVHIGRDRLIASQPALRATVPEGT